jgi:glutamyl-tRNA reductase
MKLQMVGCSHHHASLDVLERVAFTPEQVRGALAAFRDEFPDAEAVLLSTCNRVELYTATDDTAVVPDRDGCLEFLAQRHGLNAADFADAFCTREGDEALRHLFTVVASLDSMVVGEAQILSQVKQAYELACDTELTGPQLHAVFQAALRVAKRVATETTLHQRRVSIPSVAVADFAASIFERFDNKQALLIGAGEMGEETLQYLIAEGTRQIEIVNRSEQRAAELADRYGGQPRPWTDLDQLLLDADLVVSTTGANEPIVTLERYRQIEPQRFERPLFILDLAVPRDFDPAIGDCAGVYLYCIGDLEQACQRNRAARRKAWPKAERIIEEEIRRCKTEESRRIAGPTIRRLKERADRVKQDELKRLINKLDNPDPRARDEIAQSFDRLVNKLLHPPLESLRDQAERGTPHGLLAALRELFQLKE